MLETIAAFGRIAWAPIALLCRFLFGKVREPIGAPAKFALGVASILVLIASYSLLSYQRHQENPRDTTVPNASQFVEGWQKVIPKKDSPTDWFDKQQRKKYLESSWLYVDVIASFTRLFAGLSIGVIISLVVGMAMGCLPRVEAFFSPTLSFLAKIPPTAMLAVYFVLLGTDFELFIGMIAFGIFPTLAQGIYQAAKKDVTDHAVNKSLTLGASQMEVIWNVVFQQVLPRVIENVRLQIGPAMVFLIAAEWLVADEGFGYRLRMQSRLLNMNVVYIYLIILGAIGFLMDLLLSWTRRKLSPWFGE